MQTNIRIVLLEDDPIQAEWIVDEVIRAALPNAELQYYDSEHSFSEAVKSGELQRWNPQFAILDLGICYYSLDELEEMPAPPTLNSGGNSREAGIRCREALQKVCPKVKVGIITVLDETPDGLVIQKGDDDGEKLTAFLTQELSFFSVVPHSH